MLEGWPLNVTRRRQYYKAKSMTKDQIAVFIEERKWDYRGMYTRIYRSRFTSHPRFVCATAFGFTAALAERIPIIGLIFSVSNRIGAAMWAHGMHSVRISVYSDKLSGTTFQISRRGSTTLRLSRGPSLPGACRVQNPRQSRLGLCELRRDII